MLPVNRIGPFNSAMIIDIFRFILLKGSQLHGGVSRIVGVTLSAIECHWVPFLGKTAKSDKKWLFFRPFLVNNCKMTTKFSIFNILFSKCKLSLQNAIKIIQNVVYLIQNIGLLVQYIGLLIYRILY